MFMLQFETYKLDDIVRRKLDENRAEYNQLMIEALLPPPQGVCCSAVHVENVISLVKYFLYCLCSDRTQEALS